MEGHLIPFTRFAQALLTGILCFLLPNDAAFNTCDSPEHGLHEILRTAKYGSAFDPEMQKSVLSYSRLVLSRLGFLGKLKTLVYIASLEVRVYMGVSLNIEAEMKGIGMSRRPLRARWFGKWSIKYAWGGDLSQFKPILEKTINFLQNELVLLMGSLGFLCVFPFIHLR
jgi:hypothetical protein